MTALRRRGLTLVLGTAIGYGLWISWSHVLDRGSPFDGGARYLGCLFLVGGLLALLRPEEPWLAPLGVYLGQCAALAGETAAGLAGDPAVFPLHLLYLVSVTLAAVFGAAVTSALQGARRMA